MQGGRSRILVGLVMAGVIAAGCAVPRPEPAVAAPPFRFATDTLAFANDTLWAYEVDGDHGTTWRRREQAPRFVLHCSNMVRAVRQFHLQARFAPDQPRPDAATLGSLVAAVLASDPRAKVPSATRIVIPGYTDLRAASAAEPMVFEGALGGPWRSFAQRGNWRMIFPFTPRHQRDEAEALVAALRRGETPILHALRFPVLDLNHTLLVFAVEETPADLRFQVYDPNDAPAPIVVRWDRGARTFVYPRTPYFAGGAVKAYRVYDGTLS